MTKFVAMFQNILIVLLFIAAIAYVGWMVFKSFRGSAAGCASGCGKCGAVDFNKLEKQLKEKGL
jgi:hypothetical protein